MTSIDAWINTMSNTKNFQICDYGKFVTICRSAQDRWEDLERSYRDYDGDIEDSDGYLEAYVLRLQWILEKVLPDDHPAFEDHENHEGLARFLIIELYNDCDEEIYQSFYILDEAEDMYQFLSTLHEDYE